MTNKDAIRSALSQSQMLYGMLTNDLSDEDLHVRPVPGANSIAWQLGHTLIAEHRFLSMMGATMPPLPAGFVEAHDSANSKAESPKGLLTKAEYMKLWEQTRGAALQALDKATDADFAKLTEGPISRIAPTHGDLWLLLANHVSFHAGQFSVVRRKLGKPVMF